MEAENHHAKHIVAACYLGWALDAFDFFIMVFVFDDVAKAFGTTITAVTWAVTLTLGMRAAGAYIFGRMADRYGRRPVLMLSVLSFSVLEFMSGLAPNLWSFLALRALFGLAMGGEWGIGASLTMESIPSKWRGIVSGLLQAGYPSGYLLATITFWLAYPYVGWRGMFFIGALPALLVLYIRSHVPESPDWVARQQVAEKKAASVSILAMLQKNLKLAVYAVVMMMAFNFYSHGTQDLYPKLFLGKQHGFSHDTISTIAIVYNLGAMLGGVLFGAFSQKVGRRAAIITACVLSLPVIPLWAFSSSPVVLALGAFLMQFFVQGAWGIVPAHLNELSPAEIRATFPGVVYQLGNLLASTNAPLQSWMAGQFDGNYGIPLAIVAGSVAVLIIVLMIFGREARDVKMGGD